MNHQERVAVGPFTISLIIDTESRHEAGTDGDAEQQGNAVCTHMHLWAYLELCMGMHVGMKSITQLFHQTVPIQCSLTNEYTMESSRDATFPDI